MEIFIILVFFFEKIKHEYNIYYLGFLRMITFGQYDLQFCYRSTLKRHISILDTLYEPVSNSVEIFPLNLGTKFSD